MSPRLSLVMPFYGNHQMLAKHFETWSRWPPILQRSMEIVIVDDASAVPAWESPAWRGELFGRGGLPPMQLLRVKVDKPWNQHGARNLGAHVATGKWLMMTDMDHLIPTRTLKALHDLGDEEAAHFFGRRDAPAGRWHPDDWPLMAFTRDREGRAKPHVNSFALTRELYWRVGGYDEDYCGTYGTDAEFRRRLDAKSRRIVLPVPLIRVDRSVIADASTTTLPRKEGRDPQAKAKIRAAKAARGEANVIKTLQFEWERIL